MLVDLFRTRPAEQAGACHAAGVPGWPPGCWLLMYLRILRTWHFGGSRKRRAKCLAHEPFSPPLERLCRSWRIRSSEQVTRSNIPERLKPKTARFLHRPRPAEVGASFKHLQVRTRELNNSVYVRASRAVAVMGRVVRKSRRRHVSPYQEGQLTTTYSYCHTIRTQTTTMYAISLADRQPTIALTRSLRPPLSSRPPPTKSY
ncbi:hypothetical protein LX36DRAFT_347116 [Colletotrichum falcatum]|nr:hypothetical protein LX36DRAFT_347116 [Colletotrichum falcatum]